MALDLEYYPIPIDLDKIMKGKHLDNEVEIRKSIHQNIRLILRSFMRSYRYDPSFGCLMNKFHARTPPQGMKTEIWKDNMRAEIQNNLKDMFQRYETRIEVKDVFVEIKRSKNTKDAAMVNVNVEVVGNLSLGRKEKFYYPDSEVEEDAQEVLPLMIPLIK